MRRNLCARYAPDRLHGWQGFPRKRVYRAVNTVSSAVTSYFIKMDSRYISIHADFAPSMQGPAFSQWDGLILLAHSHQYRTYGEQQHIRYPGGKSRRDDSGDPRLLEQDEQ